MIFHVAHYHLIIKCFASTKNNLVFFQVSEDMSEHNQFEQYRQKLNQFSERAISFVSSSELEEAAKMLLLWVNHNHIDEQEVKSVIEMIKRIFQEFQYLSRLMPMLSLRNLEIKYQQSPLLSQYIAFSKIKDAYLKQNQEKQTNLQQAYQPQIPQQQTSYSRYQYNGVSFKMLHCQMKDHTFELGETIVTQKLWQEIMGFNPSQIKGDQNPVHNISYMDCMTFCNLLSMKLGYRPYYHMIGNASVAEYQQYRTFLRKNKNLKEQGFRLPTSIEWQYMVKDGVQFENQDELGTYAWLNFNAHQKIHPVKTKKANHLGFYDVIGHVWEWCSDHKHHYRINRKRHTNYQFNYPKVTQRYGAKDPFVYTKKIHSTSLIPILCLIKSKESKRGYSYKDTLKHRIHNRLLPLCQNFITQEEIPKSVRLLSQPNAFLLGYAYSSPIYSIFQENESIGEQGCMDLKLNRHIFDRHPTYGLRLVRTKIPS
jgi:hypothetical protein